MPRNRRKPAEISQPLHQRLNSYTLAANATGAGSLSPSWDHTLSSFALAVGAAGVGVLAFAQPVQAKIVYTPQNLTIAYYKLDLNNDGIPDFYFDQACGHTSHSLTSCSVMDVTGARHNGMRVKCPYCDLLALPAGVRLGPRAKFLTTSRNWGMAGRDHTLGGGFLYSGYFANGGKGVKNRYLGFKFLINGQYHYGWARFSVSFPDRHLTVVLTGYAYETIPNTPIVTGQTKGPEQNSLDENSLDEANPSNLSEPILQPAGLGLLAMGSPGLSIWRREESAPEGN